MVEPTRQIGWKRIHNEKFEDMAREMVGDGGSPNVFFVSDEHGIFLITTDFDTAHEVWTRLPTTRESSLEDRKTGTIASTEPGGDWPGAPLVSYDDSKMRLRRRNAYARRPDVRVRGHPRRMN